MQKPETPHGGSDPPDDWCSLDDLCERTGESRRTIRFYMLNGLLSAPTGAGSAARYPAAHGLRLRVIRAMQAQGVQLARIRERLVLTPDDALALLLQELSQVPAPHAQRPLGTPMFAGAVHTTTPRPRENEVSGHLDLISSSGLYRSQWEHIVLEPGIELHVRRPLDVSANRRLQRLLEFAQKTGKGG